MWTVSNVEACQWYEANDVVALSTAIIEMLSLCNKEDFFGGVDEDEVHAAMKGKSKVFASKDENGKMQGFLLLQEATSEDERAYSREFPDLQPGRAMIVNGYGVAPNKQETGLATHMLQVARRYAKRQGYSQFIGTIHPQNLASEKSLQKVAKIFKKGEVFIHHTRDGRYLLRQHFLLNLI